jgi:hypothetical protein
MRGMGCALYIRCALSIHQKECRKSLGCALYSGACYLPENTVLSSVPILSTKHNTGQRQCSTATDSNYATHSGIFVWSVTNVTQVGQLNYSKLGAVGMIKWQGCE